MTIDGSIVHSGSSAHNSSLTEDNLEVVDGVLELNMQLVLDDVGQLILVYHA